MRTLSEAGDFPADLFYGTRGPVHPRYLVVGESWGKNEHEQKRPFVGGSGRELSRLLDEAGINEKACLFTNVVPAQPPGNEMELFFFRKEDSKNEPCIRGLYPKPIVREGLERLEALIKLVQPECILAFGNYALWALTEDCFTINPKSNPLQPTGIGRWRGSQLDSRILDKNGKPFPLVPTYHPAAVLNMWSYRPYVKHDLSVRLPKVPWKRPDYQFLVRPNFAEVVDVLMGLFLRAEVHHNAENPLWLSVDLETRRPYIACIGIAWTKLQAICIPFMCVERKIGYWEDEELEFQIIVMLRELFTHPNVRIIGQNFDYDIQYMALWWGLVCRLDFDTMLAQHVMWPGTPKDLGMLSSLYCEYHRYWKDEGNEWEPSMPEEQLWEYNCKDCCATYEIKEAQELALPELGFEEQFRFYMDAYNRLILPMMLRGVRINRKRRAELVAQLTDTASEYEYQLELSMPHDVWAPRKGRVPWYRSPQQQCEIFYDLLGFPSSGKRTMDEDALKSLGILDPIFTSLTQELTEYRSLKKFREALMAKLDIDNRMRCTYKMGGPETFRLSSSRNVFGTGTNLQNLSHGTEKEE